MIYLRAGNSYEDTDRIVLTFTDDAGDPVDLTGTTVWFAIKRRRGDSDDDALVLVSTPADVAIDANPLLGLAYVTLDAETTAALPVGSWWYTAQAKDGSGRVVEVGPSRVTIERDIITTTT